MRRGRDSESPSEEPRAKRREVVESSDEDLDEANIIDTREARGNIQNIWDDDRRARDEDEDMDMDMDDFIDDEEDEEEGARFESKGRAVFDLGSARHNLCGGQICKGLQGDA